MPKVSAGHKAAVRERLLDAAHECLHEKGLEGFTTRDILERAGLSAGTLYHYFSGKDDLVMALAGRIAATEFDALSTGPDLLALVGRLLRPDNPASILPALRARARVDPHVRRALSRYDQVLVERFVPLVARAQAEGQLPAGADAAALVELVELVFEAVQTRAATGAFVTSQERVAAAFLSVLSALQIQGALA